MRLSHGFVRGENLSCIYHGWSYGIEGSCVRIPAHPGMTPPATINTQNKTVLEVGGIVWVCDGNPQSTPPEFEGLDPIRTLTIDVSPATLESFAETTKNDMGLLVISMAGVRIHMVLAPLTDQRTLAHVLVEATSTRKDRVIASRAAEAYRRMAEATPPGRAVA